MISIVIPLYNKEKTITRCIDSVLEQTYTDWELLIVNDGSTDNSANVVQPYLNDQRIQYFYKENGGVSDTRNYGILRAKGEWIVYIDADDYFLPKGLEIMLSTALKYHTKISTANFYVEYENKRNSFCNMLTTGKIRHKFFSWCVEDCMPRAGATLFEASVLKSHLFNTSLSVYEEVESIANSVREYSLSFSREYVMVYNVENSALSKTLSMPEKDLVFHIQFEGKSFWEKMYLAYILRARLKSYPGKEEYLRKKYKDYMIYVHLCVFTNAYTRIKRIFRKLIFNEFVRFKR